MNPAYLLRTTCCLLALLATTLAGRAQAQAPDWQLAVAAAHGANSTSGVYGSAPDAAGNVYLAGAFTGTITLGATTLTSAGGTDVFIAKWDPAARAFAWAQQAGGLADDRASSLAVSGASVYVAGTFASPTASFGSAALANAGSAATADIFIAKLTDAGTFGWAQRAGGTDTEAYANVAVAGPNVYLAGTFGSPTASFGSLTLTNAGPAPTGDNFVAKLTDAGATASFTWAQRFGNADYDFCEGLAVSGASVYVAGSFSATATFGSLALTSAANGDIFVAKLTDAGSSASFTWAQRGGGPANDYLTALAVSGPSVYVAGNFELPFTLGVSATFGSTTLSTPASGDGFLAKLTDTGSSASFAWAKPAGNPYTTLPGRIGAVKASGASVFVLGSFYGTTQGFGTASLASAGSTDVFLTKLTDAGATATTAWAQRAGGTNQDLGYALALSNGTVYAAGTAMPVVSFSNQVIASSAGTTVGFLAALPDATALASAPVGAPLLGVATYPSPARGTATVQLPAGSAPGAVALTVLDGLGRVVRTRTAALPAGHPTTELDVAGLAPGVYALRVAVGGRLGTTRLVVE